MVDGTITDNCKYYLQLINLSLCLIKLKLYDHLLEYFQKYAYWTATINNKTYIMTNNQQQYKNCWK